MMNAYAVLGVEERLGISDERIASAFRDAVKAAHPDAGGGEVAFQELQRAREILASPAKRLRHWMELRGVVLDPRGSVSPELMDFFVEIGAVTQRAEELIRRRDGVKSALARALMEGEVLSVREAVEELQRRLGERIAAVCAGFAEVEAGADGGLAAVLARDLAFLEKWRDALRGVFGRLL